VRRFFTHNPGLKLLAVVVALFLWVLLTGGDEAVRIYPVRIDFLTAEDHLLSGETLGSVSVYLRGPELILKSLDPSTLSLTVDLREGSPGDNQVVLDPERDLNGLPPGLAVESMTPQILAVHIERKIRRTLRIVPQIDGDPSPGCLLAGYDVRPPEAVLEGTESQLEEMTAVGTAPIEVSGRCETFTRVVSLSTGPPGVKLVNPEPVTVTVLIETSEGPFLQGTPAGQGPAGGTPDPEPTGGRP
jgi:YbbR domain-containing protein